MRHLVHKTSLAVGLALALAAPASAQRRVVTPPRPGPGPGGVIVVQPGQPPPPPPGGVIIVQPNQPPPPPPGQVVIVPGRPMPPPQPPPPGGVFIGAVPQGIPVGMAPPPPRPRRYAPPSRAGQIWQDGYWSWTGRQWQWVDGHWEFPPRAGVVWIPPQWNGSVWVPGYWNTPQGWGQNGPQNWQQPGPPPVPYQVGTMVTGNLAQSNPRDPNGGGFYQDYAVYLNAGQPVTFLCVGGPSDQQPGQRVDVMIRVLFNGRVIAEDDDGAGFPDARLTFTPNGMGLHVIRVTSYGHQWTTGTFALQSQPGNVQMGSFYGQMWGQQPVYPGQPVQQFPQPQPQPYPQPYPQPQPQPYPQPYNDPYTNQPAPGWQPPPPQPQYGLQIGATVQGFLQDGMPTDDSGGAVADYPLQLAPGQAVTLVGRGGQTQSGSQLDVVVQVLQNGRVVAEDDDSAGNRNARVIFTAPGPGVYVVRVSTWRGSMERTGSFNLSALPGQQPNAQ